jgi:hypothetical protein
MANVKPYKTTDDLVESVKLRIIFPISQSTLTYDNIVTMINEEMLLGAVPDIMSEHEEYFNFTKSFPLIQNIGRYEIPSRALGMTLRDLKYSDNSGIFTDMTRISPEDKAFFQSSYSAAQVIGKYYLEGNDIVISSSIPTNTGWLMFTFPLRPNMLVRNDRACFITGFTKTINFVNQPVAGNTFLIQYGSQTSSPVSLNLTAVVSSPTSGQFVIGATLEDTADNFVAALNSLALSNGLDSGKLTSSSVLGLVTVNYNKLDTNFITTNPSAMVVDMSLTNIIFNQLPTTYTNPETLEVDDNFFTVGTYVDFLQTNPGNRTYAYDVQIKSISGTTAAFNTSDLQIMSGNGGPNALPLTFINLKVGDYIAQVNECIIPQIPVELHTALAERAAARILSALGDTEGYARSAARIQEMNQKKEQLIGSRVEGSVSKVFNRYSLIRLGKNSARRRYW